MRDWFVLGLGRKELFWFFGRADGGGLFLFFYGDHNGFLELDFGLGFVEGEHAKDVALELEEQWVIF